MKLLEAHDGELRGLVLSADGTKLATASVKGTVIRVFDVATSTRLAEFRRGVERTTITCLAWSWDCEWLSCTSDKGTAHIFQMGGNSAAATAERADTNKSSTTTTSSLTQMLLSSVRKSVEGDAKKSIAQIRGVPHPQACAFVGDAPNLLAVAGWDADGNGVLLLSEFNATMPGEEPRRVGYHVLCKSAVHVESEEARRRRRLRGWKTPEILQTPEGGRLYIGDRLEILEMGMEQIQFEEKDEFVSVTAVRHVEAPDIIADYKVDSNQGRTQGEDAESSQNIDEMQNSSNLGSGTVGDSVQTEPLDDDAEPSES
jgi:hypothetical protein